MYPFNQMPLTFSILRITTVAALGFVLVYMIWYIATAEAATSATKESYVIFKEVMTECHHHKTAEALFYVTAAPLGQVVATKEQEKAYLADNKHFEVAQQHSKCWTRERWERYVHAVLEEDRAQYGAKK